MKQKHNNWYMHIFSYPVVVKDLLLSFVHEDFVKDLEFASLKRLNPDFFPASEKSRHADVIYEPKNRSRLTRITRNLLRIKAFSPFGLITSR